MCAQSGHLSLNRTSLLLNLGRFNKRHFTQQVSLWTQRTTHSTNGTTDSCACCERLKVTRHSRCITKGLSSEAEDHALLDCLCRPFDGCSNTSASGCAAQSGKPAAPRGSLEQFRDTEDFWQQVKRSVRQPADERISAVIAQQSCRV